jgi:hypothetical protein
MQAPNMPEDLSLSEPKSVKRKGSQHSAGDLTIDRGQKTVKQGKELARQEMKAFAAGYAAEKAKLTTQFFQELEQADPVRRMLDQSAALEIEDDEDDADFFGATLGGLSKLGQA